MSDEGIIDLEFLERKGEKKKDHPPDVRLSFLSESPRQCVSGVSFLRKNGISRFIAFHWLFDPDPDPRLVSKSFSSNSM